MVAVDRCLATVELKVGGQGFRVGRDSCEAVCIIAVTCLARPRLFMNSVSLLLSYKLILHGFFGHLIVNSTRAVHLDALS